MNIPVLTAARFYATLLCFAALLAALGLQTMRVSWKERDIAELKAHAAGEAARQAEAVTKAVNVQRAEFERRINEREGIINETVKRNAELQSAVDAGNNAADRLRKQLAAFVAASRQARPDSAAGPTSTPAVTGTDPLDLLAGLYGRLDEAAGTIGRYADDLAIRLGACNAQYDSLSASP